MLYQLIVYVPLADALRLKEALFEAGAGKYNLYDQCSWETKGTGQFRPLNGSHPTLGKQNQLERVEEIKIETICEKEVLKHVLETLKQYHPYEEPAYGVIELKTLEDLEEEPNG